MISESDLIACLKQGMKPRQIQEALNASQNEVAHALKCAGTARCGAISNQAMREKILVEWIKHEYDYEEISFLLGCSKALAREVVTKAKNDRKRRTLARKTEIECEDCTPTPQWGDKTFGGQKVLVLRENDGMSRVLLIDGSITWIQSCAIKEVGMSHAKESVGFNPKESVGFNPKESVGFNPKEFA